ncbi:protein indeterminate-domain 12-like [Diospyros lotus]|uniref:protein indeterminate-domain 12-like n=1 Tax=Diospyros lotus TaxID=55363 RepID=UPI002251C3BA|nr:protein indeterminate-domain 12-like [Diospyros lotus]
MATATNNGGGDECCNRQWRDNGRCNRRWVLQLASSTISPNKLQPQKIKKKRNLPGHPDPDAEVIALSPKSLLATTRYVCEICNKGFQREQNLELHKRGHNLPWKLKQRRGSGSKETNGKNNSSGKRAYVCPEPTCVHHHPSRALGDLTGIKKHFSRKHGEKKWKCDKCSKIYAVLSDWKAHSKACGSRKYTCRCGTLFFRKDSFITHKAFCEALAEESARLSSAANQQQPISFHLHPSPPPPLFQPLALQVQNPNPTTDHRHNPFLIMKPETLLTPPSTIHGNPVAEHGGACSATLSSAHLSATAATVGAQPVGHVGSTMPTVMGMGAGAGVLPEYRLGLTRDLLGLTREECGNNKVRGRNALSFTGR